MQVLLYAEGRTALCHASDSGDVVVIEVLLDGGAGPNLAGWWSHSPLHCAAMEGRTSAVKTLLDRGAQPNYCQNVERSTAASCIAGGGPAAVEILDLLVQANADLLLKDRRGWNAFTCASEGACLRFVMRSAWHKLTWCDVFPQYMDRIFTYVCWNCDQANTCKTLRTHAQYNGCRTMVLQLSVALPLAIWCHLCGIWSSLSAMDDELVFGFYLFAFGFSFVFLWFLFVGLWFLFFCLCFLFCFFRLLCFWCEACLVLFVLVFWCQWTGTWSLWRRGLSFSRTLIPIRSAGSQTVWPLTVSGALVWLVVCIFLILVGFVPFDN